MKYALIGCGRISKNHIKAAIENKFEIIAICDLLEERMDNLIQLFNLSSVKKYKDYKKMLDENDITLVSIATESGSHAKIGLDVLDHNINVIIEKPMAMSIRDAKDLINLANKKKLVLSALHQNRFNIAVQKLREAIEQNRFGKISHASIHVRWNRNKNYYEQAPWRGTWSEDGGALMNQCIHGIDLLRWMMGDEIEEVYGVTKQQFHNYLEAEDLGVAIVKFKNGGIGMIEGTTNVYPKNLEETLYIFGEKGSAKIGGTSTNNIDLWQFDNENEEDKKIKEIAEHTSNVYGNGHINLFKDVKEAILEKRSPYVDGRAGLRALELVLGVYKSQKLKKVIKFPVDDFSSIDMMGEF